MNRNLPRVAYRPREAAEVTGLFLRFLYYDVPHSLHSLGDSGKAERRNTDLLHASVSNANHLATLKLLRA